MIPGPPPVITVKPRSGQILTDRSRHPVIRMLLLESSGAEHGHARADEVQCSEACASFRRRRVRPAPARSRVAAALRGTWSSPGAARLACFSQTVEVSAGGICGAMRSDLKASPQRHKDHTKVHEGNVSVSVTGFVDLCTTATGNPRGPRRFCSLGARQAKSPTQRHKGHTKTQRSDDLASCLPLCLCVIFVSLCWALSSGSSRDLVFLFSLAARPLLGPLWWVRDQNWK